MVKNKESIKNKVAEYGFFREIRGVGEILR